MPNLVSEVTEVLRKRLQHAFQLGWGTHTCTLYSYQSSKNFYGDVLQQVALKMTEVQVAVEYASPKRVVQAYGWYKEGDVLPIIAYFPYYGVYASVSLVFGETQLKFVSRNQGNRVSVEFVLGEEGYPVVSVRDTSIVVQLGVENGVVVSSVLAVKQALDSTASVVNLVSVSLLGDGEVLAGVVAKQHLFSDVVEIAIGDAFIIDAPVGQTDYSDGTYRVLEVLTFGHNLPIGWIARVEPLREFTGDGAIGGISVTGVDCLYFEGGALATAVDLIGEESVCIPWRVNPINATNKEVVVELLGNLKWVCGHVSLLDPGYEDSGQPVGGIFRVTTVDGGYSFDVSVNGVTAPLLCKGPTINVEEGLVSMSCGTPGSVVKYSIDGTEPSLQYIEPFLIERPVVIKAVAYAPQFEDSVVVELVLPEE